LFALLVAKVLKRQHSRRMMSSGWSQTFRPSIRARVLRIDSAMRRAAPPTTTNKMKRLILLEMPIFATTVGYGSEGVRPSILSSTSGNTVKKRATFKNQFQLRFRWDPYEPAVPHRPEMCNHPPSNRLVGAWKRQTVPAIHCRLQSQCAVSCRFCSMPRYCYESERPWTHQT
jgi:hypothetical protein